MTLAERIGTRPPSADGLPFAKPEIRKSKQYQSAAMQFEMQIPEDWQETTFGKPPDHIRLASDVGFDRADSQLDVYRIPNFFMSAESMTRNRRSNLVETVSRPIQISVDGKTAWLINVCKNPTVLTDASNERDAISTECVFNDDDGSVRTIVFSSPSASIHHKQMPMFMQMLSSLRLTK